MSDHSSGVGPYECCSEPMREVRLPRVCTSDTLFFCCYSCGVWRHKWPRGVFGDKRYRKAVLSRLVSQPYPKRACDGQ